MDRTILTTLTVALLQAGCSSTIAVRRPLTEGALAELNDAIGGSPATVTTARTGEATERVAVRDVKVGVTTTQWLEPDGPRTVPTEAVRQIAVVKHGRGAAEGLGIGMLVGAAVGAIAGFNWGNWGNGFCNNSGRCFGGLGALIEVGLGALVGGFFGSFNGFAFGHVTTADFGYAVPPSGGSGSGSDLRMSR